MTLNVQYSWQDYTTDGVQTVFPYPFYLKEKQDLAAYWEQAGTPPWHPGQALPMPLPSAFYTITGLGQPSGGTLVTQTPLPAGRLVLRRGTPQNQLTDYLEGDAFPAASHETALDRLTVLVQDHAEVLSRASLLRVETGTPHRGLALPDPQPNTVLGWDSQAAQWTLYPSGVTQIAVDPVSGIGWGKNTVALTPAAGAAQAAALVFPPGVLVLAVTVWVQTTLGASQGLQQVGIGTAERPDCWGMLPSLSADTTSTAGILLGYGGQPLPVSGLVTLTAYGGQFDGTGTVYLTGHFTTFGAAKTLGYSYHPGSPDDSVLVPPVNAPPASETESGVTRYGTPAETVTGLLSTVATHPAGVKTALDARVAASGTALSVARYGSGGGQVEATPGLLTSSDGRLGVGGPPASGIALQVQGVTETREGNVRLIREGVANTSLELWLHQAALSVAPAVIGSRTSGSAASPTATPAGAALLRLGGRVHDGTQQVAGMSAYIELLSAAQASPTERGTVLALYTTLLGTTAAAERLRIDGAGNLTTTGGNVGSGMAAGLALKSGTPPSSSPADAVQLWVADVEGTAGKAGLHVRSESGILTRIGDGVLTRQVLQGLPTATTTTPYAATAEDAGKLFMGTNSSAMAQVTLPAAATGLVYEFLAHVVQGLRVRTQASNNIRFGAAMGATGAAIETTTVGASMRLVAINTSTWQTMWPTTNWTQVA